MEQCVAYKHEITCVGLGNSATLQDGAGEASVRLVPNVLKRLFLSVSPADNVNCHAVHWLIRSIACCQLYFLLAKPRNGIFLLKWPLCFHYRDDVYDCHRQFRYLDLIRYNVSLKVPPREVINEIQLFLAGYEKMLLDEVLASAIGSCYSDLQTLIIDFSLYEHADVCTDTQTFPMKNALCHGSHQKNDKKVVHDDWCSLTNELFLGNWLQWARTITAITDSCRATLSHFIFTADSFARNASWEGSAIRLPMHLYRKLNFNNMLGGMRNLKTLYLPIYGYPKASAIRPEDGTNFEFVSPIIRNVARGKLLPMLQRVVILDGGYNSYRSESNGAFTSSSKMPLLPKKIVIECEKSLEDDIAAEVENSSRAFTFVPRYDREVNITTAWMSAIDGDVTDVWPYVRKGDGRKGFRKAISNFVNDEVTVYERQLRLSAWNDMAHSSRAPAAQQKAVIVVQVADLCKTRSSRDNSTLKVSETLKTLFDMLKTRQICSSAVRIVIEEVNLPSKGRWGWGLMHQILPFFAVDEADGHGTAAGGDDAVLDSIRLNMKMGEYFTTFGAKLRLWRKKAEKRKIGNGNVFTQHYKFPGIYLTIKSCVRVNYVEAEVTTASECAEAIEHAMKAKIGVLLRDAVDSCSRRDISYYLYRSVKRIQYESDVVMCDKCGKLKRQVIVALHSRAAEFERRVADEVCELDLKLEGEKAIMFWRLAGLVRHKVLKFI